MQEKTLILDDKAIDRTITRIAHEIIERNEDLDNVILVGIKTRGAIIAKRLHQKIQDLYQKNIAYGDLDISLYRDDLSEIPQDRNPVLNATNINHDINNKNVILVDDVLFTGRTIRAAMDALIDLGRPAVIQLAILVDRGHRQLPIKADYVGKNIPTSNQEKVVVSLSEVDQENKVSIYE